MAWECDTSQKWTALPSVSNQQPFNLEPHAGMGLSQSKLASVLTGEMSLGYGGLGQI